MGQQVKSTIRDDLGLSKGALFVDEYIRNGFNGTQAALRVFDLKSETEELRYQTASVIAHEYLNKPKIQQMLTDRTNNSTLSVEWLLGQLKKHAENHDKPQISMQALDRLAHIMHVETKPSPQAQQAVAPTQIHLNLPSAPAGQSVPAPKVIESHTVDKL